MLTPAPRSLCALLVAGPLLVPVACDKKPEDTKTTAEAPKPEPKDPATLVTGDKPTVPEVFKGLEPGMSLEEAKKKLPSLPEGDRIEDPAYGKMPFYVYIPKDETEIKTLRFQLPKAKALEIVKSKWGEPVVGEDIGKPVHYWFNPDKGIRASLKESFGEDMDLELERYEPAAKLLGEGKDIAFLSKAPVLGATPEALKAAYPQWWYEESAEEAAKNKAAIDKLTEGKSAGITSAKPSARLELPPTEYGSNFMWVNLSWGDDGKVERYSFDISYRQVEGKKDEIFAIFEKKWGAGKKEDKYGSPIFVYSETPFITVEPNDITKTWDITVTPKR